MGNSMKSCCKTPAISKPNRAPGAYFTSARVRCMADQEGRDAIIDYMLFCLITMVGGASVILSSKV
jgi:hypothetical protein